MIELRNITIDYGRRRVLNDITMLFGEGEIVAILGPNGCGKTTLLRIVAGLLRPTSGAVWIDNEPIEKYSALSLARKMAFVRQHSRTDFDFTAFEMVLMGRNPYQRRLQNESEEDRRIVERCMKETGTWELRESCPSQMSGGELQRVMIARALAQTTPILLLDEPVSNLDIAHQIEIMQLLRRRHSEGEKRLTTIVVLHDLNLALRFADRVLLMHQGEKVYCGPTADGLTRENILKVYGIGTHRSEGTIIFDY